MNRSKQEKSSSKIMPKIIVQKYGGATLSDPEKIKQVAKRIVALSNSGTQVVAAVSAMGKTTNQLLALAQQISAQPNRRELDMLLTTGERISMALLCMALHDLDCDAISFTGSQAGILTDEAHVNASIIDVKAHRILEALNQNKVVVLAGFQGVSPLTKDITTLGRGGTDTTAIAMAAFLGAERCEILKDVPAVFSADPNLVANAKPIHHLSYDQMLDMTFWGAKVLHYRSVELAKVKQVQIYIGLASATTETGTLIPSKESSVFETVKILSLTPHIKHLRLCKNF
jgi:aspartate kinase